MLRISLVKQVVKPSHFNATVSKRSPFKYSALAAGIAITTVTATAAVASPPAPAPLYQSFDRYSTLNPINGDATDIYFPTTADESQVVDLPVVLLLQGALVDKSAYSEYASQVARYGFAVAVPNHVQTVPDFGEVLAPDVTQVQDVLDQFVAESNNPNSPLSGKIDPQKYGLLGHSLGGAVGLSAIGEICTPPLCFQPFEKPEALAGSAFFGANLRDENDTFFPISNEGIGIALIQGNQDGRALPVNAERTFENIQTPPKALITLNGVNHFGITNTNMPAGAIPDPNPQSIAQEASIETVARWSGLFLRGTVLEDKDALDYVLSNGVDLDPNVVEVVGAEAKPVPEPDLFVGVAGGLFSLFWLKKRATQHSLARSK